MHALLYPLTNDQSLGVSKVVLGNLEVERSGASSDSAGNVVMGSVAGAEPAAKVSSLTNGHTTQMGADSDHDQPLGLLHSLVVSLGVSQGSNVDLVGLFNLFGGSVSDENGLSSPLDDDVLTEGNGTELDLDLGHGQNVSGSRHVGKEVLDGGLGAGSGEHAKRSNHEVGEETVGICVSVLLEVRSEVGDLVCGLATNGL